MFNLLANRQNWTFGNVCLPRRDLIELSSTIYDNLKSKAFRHRYGLKKAKLATADDDTSVMFHAISVERWSNSLVRAWLMDLYSADFDLSQKGVAAFMQKINNPYTLMHTWCIDGSETIWRCELFPEGSSNESIISWMFSSNEVDSEVGNEDWENEWRTAARVMGASEILVEESFEKLRYPEHRTADRISYLPRDPNTRLVTSFAPGPPFPVSLDLLFPSNQTSKVLSQFDQLQADTYKRRGKPTIRELEILVNSEDSKSYTEDLDLLKMWTIVEYIPNDDAPRYTNSPFSAKLAESNLPIAIPVYGMTALRDEIEIAVALINAVHLGSPSRNVCLEIQTQQGPELLNDLAQACGFEVDIWSGAADSRWGWFE